MLLRRVGVESKPDRATVRAIAEGLYPVIVQGRELSRDIALTFYNEQRRAYASEPLGTVVAAPHYDLAGLVDELRRTLSTANPSANAAAMVVRHVEQGGRESITQQSRADPVAIASARVPTGRETCSFCMMLVSRGPVYSRTSGDFPAHDRCDCVAVPVFDRHDYAGRDEYVRAYEAWKRATEGKSGKDALNAYRRAQYTPRRTRDDETGGAAA